MWKCIIVFIPLVIIGIALIKSYFAGLWFTNFSIYSMYLIINLFRWCLTVVRADFDPALAKKNREDIEYA